MRRTLLIVLSGLALTSCATELAPGAEKVRIATAGEKTGCRSLGIVSTEARLGHNKAGSAMNAALNETAARGGNAVYVVSSALDGLEGASVILEALACP